MENPASSDAEVDAQLGSPLDPALREGGYNDASPQAEPARPANGPRGAPQSAYPLSVVRDAEGAEVAPEGHAPPPPGAPGGPPPFGPYPFGAAHPWGYMPHPGYQGGPGGPGGPPPMGYDPQNPYFYQGHGPPPYPYPPGGRPPPAPAPASRGSSGSEEGSDTSEYKEDGEEPPAKKAKKTKKLSAASAAYDVLRKTPRKANIACYYCRKRKIKCDEIKPACGACLRQDRECIYDNEVRRRGKGKKTRDVNDPAVPSPQGSAREGRVRPKKSKKNLRAGVEAGPPQGMQPLSHSQVVAMIAAGHIPPPPGWNASTQRVES